MISPQRLPFTTAKCVERKDLDVSRPYRRICLFGVSAVFVLFFAAAGSRLYSQPQVEPETQDAHGVSVRTGAFVTHVELWSDNIVRVQHRPVEAAAPAPSLSVIATPGTVTWQTREAGDDLLLTTSKLEIHIDRHDGCVRIDDLVHHSVLDERCEATWINAADVGSAANTLTSGQRFTLDPDESLFGLGQHPSLNTLNLVGTSVRLLQRNGDVGIPVLLSSKGYLLLWDDPAITNIDIGKSDPGSVAWQSEAGSGVDYYVVAGSRPDDAIAGYRWLTGVRPDVSTLELGLLAVARALQDARRDPGGRGRVPQAAYSAGCHYPGLAVLASSRSGDRPGRMGFA